MPEIRLPIDGLRDPSSVTSEKPPTDYGTGRRCTECGCKVNRYTAPQPKTGLPFCNVHWKLPDGYVMSATGVVKDRRRVA